MDLPSDYFIAFVLSRKQLFQIKYVSKERRVLAIDINDNVKMLGAPSYTAGERKTEEPSLNSS